MTALDEPAAAPQRDSRLTDRIMGELLAGATWDECAERIGCGRSTVARRARDPRFRERLVAERSARLRRLGDRLSNASTMAIDTLTEIMSSATATDAARVRAAAWTLRLGALVREEGDLTARVAALEANARAELRAIPGGKRR